MKKQFTILFSVLFSLSLLAQETNFIEEKDSFSSKAANCPANSLFNNGGENGGWALTSSINQGTVSYFKFHGTMLPAGAVIEGFHTWGLMAYNSGSGWAQCAADNMAFVVSFFADDEGEPGALINEQTVTASAITTTDIAFGTWTVKRMEINLTTPVAFNEGYIAIASTNAETCWFLSISAMGGEQNVYFYNNEGDFVQRMITPTGGDPYAASVLLCVTGTVSAINSATIDPSETSIDFETGGIISTVITWNDATQLEQVLISFPGFPEIPIQEVDEESYTLVDNGDGTATFSFDTNQPKGKFGGFNRYTMIAHFHFVFDVGDNAILVINITNWLWWADFEVRDIITGNAIDNATIYIQELDETIITDEWGWADIDLDVGTYTMNISADGYTSLQNQTIVVEAGFDNEFLFELMPEGADFNTYFHFGVVDGTRPAWFSDGGNTERGLTAYGNSVYVASLNSGIHTLVLDRLTGLQTGELNTTGISGGYFALNDIEASADGHIIGFNMFLSGGEFKAYKLHQTSNPEVILSASVAEGRYGDKATLVGSLNDGSALILAANGSAPNILKWSMMLDGGKGWVFNPTPQVIPVSDVGTGAAGTPVVAPLPDGSFYWTANGRSVTKHNANGSLIGTIPGTLLSTGTNSTRFLGKQGNDDIIAVFAYGANNENARVVKVANGVPDDAELLFVTPTLRGEGGANANGTGDVAFVPYLDGNVGLYVLSTNVGIGGYGTNLLNLQSPVYPPPASATYSATFTVVNAANQIAINDAVITLGTTTNPVGNYVFGNLQAGSYPYTVSRVGFFTVNGTITVTNANVTQTVQLSIDNTNVPEPVEPQLLVFPNPASLVLNVKSDSQIIEFNLTNMLGQVVYSGKQLGDSHQVNVSSFNQGMYFVRVSTENGVFVRKVLIRR